jgi:hypothetical protein
MARPISAKVRILFWVVTLAVIALGAIVLFLLNFQSAMYSPDPEEDHPQPPPIPSKR